MFPPLSSDPPSTSSPHNGTPHLSAEWAGLERCLFERLRGILQHAGYLEIGVPSLISRATVERQGAVAWADVLRVDPDTALAGSAEQGILERYADQVAKPVRLFALNQCFRGEPSYQGFKRLREFRKLELYGFALTDAEARAQYEEARALVGGFIDSLRVRGWRWVDATERDPGYHKTKWDLEVETAAYGWMETHSAAYYGTEHADRFGITGARYSWCSTGLASPRILIPLLEMQGTVFP